VVVDGALGALLGVAHTIFGDVARAGFAAVLLLGLNVVAAGLGAAAAHLGALLPLAPEANAVADVCSREGSGLEGGGLGGAGGRETGRGLGGVGGLGNNVAPEVFVADLGAPAVSAANRGGRVGGRHGGRGTGMVWFAVTSNRRIAVVTVPAQRSHSGAFAVERDFPILGTTRGGLRSALDAGLALGFEVAGRARSNAVVEVAVAVGIAVDGGIQAVKEALHLFLGAGGGALGVLGRADGSLLFTGALVDGILDFLQSLVSR